MLLVFALLLVLDGLDAFVARAMKQFQVPGVAVGVISNGQTVLVKGYGVRGASGKLPVTPDTTFAVGSVTKSFTALTLATLADEGKLDWDKPVREYLPWFRLHDPVATDLITTRDLLTHRSGLPRYDAMRFMVRFPREELVRRLRYLPPSKSFRDVYQYNNLMYVTAGYLGGVIAGSTWEDMVRMRVFAPLGMKTSTVAVADMQRGADFAKPHARGDEVAFYDYQRFGVGPNGAVNSSVHDLLKYVRFWLDDGVVDGKRIVSVAQMRELWKPVTVASPTSMYALGWQISNMAGLRSVSHGGAITGFTAHVAMIPDRRIGVVVLNNSGSPLPDLVAQTVLDDLLGVKREDRLEEFNRRTAARKPAESAKPVPGTRPTHELSAYAGEYSHPAFGTFRVEENGGSLRVSSAEFSGRLRHFHYDVFEGMDGLARFETGPDGKVSKVYLPVESAVEPLPFTRVR